MSSYVEDALKTSRNFHRLIITVSLASIIFALSLSRPSNLVEIKRQLDELREIPFRNYQIDTEKKIEGFYRSQGERLASAFESFIENQNWLVFQRNAISERLKSPAHIGWIEIENTILSEIDNASIRQLESFQYTLDVNKDVQVLVPDVEELIPHLKEFIAQHAITGARVDNLRIGIEEYDHDAETFLIGKEEYVFAYFELASDGPFQAQPAFNSSVKGKILNVPNSSLSSWLESKNNVSDTYSVNNEELNWLPSLPSLPDGYREEKIGLVLKNVQEKISKVSPEEQIISILGTNVPGVLAVYATPLLLLSLLYYFYQHTNHLINLASSHAPGFKEFAWLPLILQSAWMTEMVVTIIVLPLISIVLLSFKIYQFEATLGVREIVSVVCVMAIVILAAGTIRNLSVTRDMLCRFRE